MLISIPILVLILDLAAAAAAAATSSTEKTQTVNIYITTTLIIGSRILLVRPRDKGILGPCMFLLCMHLGPAVLIRQTFPLMVIRIHALCGDVIRLMVRPGISEYATHSSTSSRRSTIAIIRYGAFGREAPLV